VRILLKGMNILFFGTHYVIHSVLDYDKIEVIQGNGIKVVLWFPDLEGRTIIK
jgi:hypothetical protein